MRGVQKVYLELGFIEASQIIHLNITTISSNKFRNYQRTYKSTELIL